MAETKRKTIVDVVDVRREGTTLILPENLTTERAIDVLQRKLAYDEQDVAINGPVDGFIFDAAHAFFRVLESTFGWANSVPTPGFFGPQPPQMLAIPISRTEVVEVPWGRFALPGVDGFVQTGADFKDGTFTFIVGGTVKRKHEGIVQELIERTKQYVRDHSIYRGKAFRLRLRDDDGDLKPLPEPKFLDLRPEVENELIFNRDVLDAIDTSIFTPIERTAEVRALGIPLKRGILLAGKFGTGKSMTSSATAIKAVRHGWTFIVAERADELADVLRMAREYGPSVVFCEDIDRVMKGERSVDMDHILNVIDGVESKNSELMVILTTNDVEKINRAMLRPGRLDAIINVTPPDADSTERLMRLYGRGLVEDGADITVAAKLMSGNIAAVVQEATERAKLAALRRMPISDPADTLANLRIDNESLVVAANSMNNQLELLAERPEDKRSPQEKAAHVLAEALRVSRTNGEVS